MSFDGIVTRALVNELNKKIINGKVDKIYQQEKDEILLNIYNNGENHKLLISASDNNPRIYLTDYSKENPQSPPMFCMLLRKHIQGGIILDIGQLSLDRIIYLDIKSFDEMGQMTIKRLIVEIMGRHSNIILIDKNTNTIYDSIKRIPENISSVRQILPGLQYKNPPIGDKISPIEASMDDFFKAFSHKKRTLPVFKFFYTSFIGLSPLVSREICYNANIEIDRSINSLTSEEKSRLFNSFETLINKVTKYNFKPVLIKKQNNIIAFHALDLNQYGDLPKQYFSSISKMLDKYYRKKDILDRIKQKSHSIKKTIQTKLERSLNKLGKQKKELKNSLDRNKYKIYGDLITSNIHKMERGLKEIEVENFYSENLEKITIPLNTKLSPADNAQKNYKKYTKLKNAYNLLKKQIPETEKEIEYLENVLISIDNCTELEELDEIKTELIEEGYIKKHRKNKKNSKIKRSKPYNFISSDGFDIYVGKNNKQNDYLTLKFAHKEDLWFHTKDIPGSHVIIRKNNKDFSKTAIQEASILAGYFSKGRNSQNLPVDYTQVKNVKKPSGAKPGMVIYENHSTLYVTPKEEYINNLEKVEY